MTETNILSTVRSVSTGELDADVDAVFEAHGVPQKWRDLFRPLVYDACRNAARAVTRDLERYIFDGEGHVTCDTH